MRDWADRPGRDYVTSVADELAQLSTVPVAVFLLDAVDILLAAGRRDVASRLTGGDLQEPPLIAPQRLQVKAMLRGAASRCRGSVPSGADGAAQDRVAVRARPLSAPSGRSTPASHNPDEIELLRDADELFERLGATAWLERNRVLMAQVAA